MTSRHPHQVVGVEWLKQFWTAQSGCILADDMGLGKTVQTCVFLRHLMERNDVIRVLILSPKSVISQWESHLRLYIPGLVCHLFHGGGREKRFKNIEADHHMAVITTYETFRCSVGVLRTQVWDVWVCDEATAMKNPRASIWKAASSFSATCRLLLTGTPIMNRYEELWALMDIVQPGILETYPKFCRKYACLLNKKSWYSGRRESLITELRNTVMPYILRRTKESVFGKACDLCEQLEKAKKAIELPPKTEIIVWQKLTSLQFDVYASSKKRIDLRDRRAVLFNITYLKKLCRHPILCLPKSRQIWRDQVSEEDEDLVQYDLGESQAGDTKFEETEDDLATEIELISSHIDQSSAESLRSGCEKLEALFGLLPRLSRNGHAILIFSESTATLDLVEVAVMSQLPEVQYRRVDGTLTLKNTTKALEDFKVNPDVSVLLISTGSGCFGLNLTKADRVILLDPSWNPAKDAQAIDRAHRIGQTRPVTVYRFITGGAIEDNMIRLQMFKRNLSSSILIGAIGQSWFSTRDLRDLFSLSTCEESETRKKLENLLENEEKLVHDIAFDLEFVDPFAVLRAVGFSSFDEVIRQIEKER